MQISSTSSLLSCNALASQSYARAKPGFKNSATYRGLAFAFYIPPRQYNDVKRRPPAPKKSSPSLALSSDAPQGFLWPTAEIEAAIKSISGKKESLRKAWEVPSSSSSSFVSFNLEWKDLDEHFSALEKSVLELFEELQAKEAQITALAVSSRPEAKPTPVVAPAPAAEPEATPRPELKSLFAEIDARGLRSFLNEKRKEFGGIRNYLNPAIRAAPDPAKLVLDVIDGFYPLKSKGHKDDTDTQMIRRTCISLLECVQVIAPDIKPAVRAQAKKLAMEWKGKMDG